MSYQWSLSPFLYNPEEHSFINYLVNANFFKKEGINSISTHFLRVNVYF